MQVRANVTGRFYAKVFSPFVKGNSLAFHSSEADLRRCTNTALKNGWYRGLAIFDAAGRAYTVKDARFARKTGEKLFRRFLAPALVEVDLEFSAHESLG